MNPVFSPAPKSSITDKKKRQEIKIPKTPTTNELYNYMSLAIQDNQNEYVQFVNYILFGI